MNWLRVDSSAVNWRPQRALPLVLLVVFSWAILFALRFAAPITILDDDQQRPLAYMLDAALNGNWIVQRDHTGDITSKPQLFTWISAGLMVATDNFTLTIPYLVCGICTLGTALAIFGLGWRFGATMAVVSAHLYLFSLVGLRQQVLIRTDSLMTFFATAALLAVFRASEGKWSWLVFWVLAVLGTLAKGPVAALLPLLALPGIVASMSLRRQPLAPVLSRTHLLGILLYGGAWALWLLSGTINAGMPFFDKIIGKELLGHAGLNAPTAIAELGIAPATDQLDATSQLKAPEKDGTWYNPTLYFLSQFAPWSLLTLAGLVFALRRKEEDQPLAFGLATHLVLGLMVFSLAAHQRPLLLMPLTPAGALLAGLTAVTFCHRWTRPLWLRAYAVVGFLTLNAVVVYYYVVRPYDRDVMASRVAADVADRLRETRLPLVFADAPYGLQFFMERMQPRISNDRAVALLTSPVPVFIVADDQEAEIRRRSGAKAVFRYPYPVAEGTTWLQRFVQSISPTFEGHPIVVLTNQSNMNVPGISLMEHSDLVVVGEKIRLKALHQRRLEVGDQSGTLSLRNAGKEVRGVTIKSPTDRETVNIEAGKTVTIRAISGKLSLDD
jgi:4-amino-4-deoxy-L-arabinose transferase-like glycosyltransferase